YASYWRPLRIFLWRWQPRRRRLFTFVRLPSTNTGFPILDLGFAAHPSVCLVVAHKFFSVDSIPALAAEGSNFINRRRQKNSPPCTPLCLVLVLVFVLVPSGRDREPFKYPS